MKDRLLKNKTLREEVVDFLRLKILRGDIKPGERVVESEVANYFNISRGPVREAVRQLEQEGLLAYKRNKGCLVKVLSPDEAWEIYLLRSSLESLSVKVCNGKIGKEYIRRMKKAAMDMEFYVQEFDVESIIEADHTFHSQIIKASKMNRLLELWSSMNGTSFAIFHTVVNTNREHIKIISEKHLKLLEVIEEGNIEKSMKEIERHYLSTGKKLYGTNLPDYLETY